MNQPKPLDMDINIQVTIGDVDYLLIPHQENFLKLPINDLLLVLVIKTCAHQRITPAFLEEFHLKKLEQDDVFQAPFYNHVIFYGLSKEELCISPSIYQELEAWGVKNWEFIAASTSTDVKSGPYVCFQGKTWEPWRVYLDDHAALMSSFKPSRQGDGSTLLKLDDTAGTKIRVIVPSRCYFTPSEKQPLAGARIIVKDNIDIARHKTTLCNRAWMDLYPPANRTAPCVQTLIDAGAIVVGKAKLQAMIMREEPLECVEFVAPFNPRGDGYLVPSGSSHGSAVGIGAYKWLDWALGSDTNGSGRKPASYNGVHAIRPSTGIMDTEGVVGQFPKFDMPVFFGRNMSLFPAFINTWYGQSPMLRQPSSSMVSRILCPKDYLPTVNPAQTQLIDAFITGLECALGVQRIEISLAEQWTADLPDASAHADLAEYLKLTGSYPYYYDAYHNLSGFREGYQEVYNKPPFIHRAMQWQWNVAKSITCVQRDFYWRRSEIYRRWLLERVFETQKQEQVTLMVLPIQEGEPFYRDSALPPYYILSGYSSLNMSPIMRGPEVTATIGTVPYNSIVSEREEHLPVAVSVLGAPGTDLLITEAVTRGMKAANMEIEVQTGRYIY